MKVCEGPSTTTWKLSNPTPFCDRGSRVSSRIVFLTIMGWEGWSPKEVCINPESCSPTWKKIVSFQPRSYCIWKHCPSYSPARSLTLYVVHYFALPQQELSEERMFVVVNWSFDLLHSCNSSSKLPPKLNYVCLPDPHESPTALHDSKPSRTPP